MTTPSLLSCEVVKEGELKMIGLTLGVLFVLEAIALSLEIAEIPLARFKGGAS